LEVCEHVKQHSERLPLYMSSKIAEPLAVKIPDNKWFQVADKRPDHRRVADDGATWR